MNRAVISIGTNLGNRQDHIKTALNKIEEQAGMIEMTSSIYETEAWGFESEHAFLNMVIQIRTSLKAQDLMKELLSIEESMGRKREKSSTYTSRPIDLDILFYEDLIINDKDLNIPHPQLHKRNFVLVPAAEILPDHVHPVLIKSVKELLLESSDQQQVVKYS